VKETDPYGFPYPECDPPLVKDSSDVAQIRDLALAVDAEVTALKTFADDEFIRPLGCKITRGGTPLSFDRDQPITFNQLEFDNSPGALMNTTQGIRITKDGWYFIAGFVSTQQLLDRTRVKLAIAGIGSILDEGEGYGIADPTVSNMMTGSIVYALYAGQLVQLWLYTAGSSAVVNTASLCVARLTAV
jgi:hypothetical protein